MQGPVTVKERDLVRAILAPHKVLTPQGPGPVPPAAPPAPDQSGYQPHVGE